MKTIVWLIRLIQCIRKDLECEMQTFIIADKIFQYIQRDTDTMSTLEYLLGRSDQRTTSPGTIYTVDTVFIAESDFIFPLSRALFGAYKLRSPKGHILFGIYLDLINEHVHIQDYQLHVTVILRNGAVWQNKLGVHIHNDIVRM